MCTVLVTGGAGFIGFHTVQRLVQENKKVIIIDHLCESYYPKEYKLKRLDLLGFSNTENNSEDKEGVIYTNKNKTVSFIKADLYNINTYIPLLQELNVEYIIHLGANASVPYSIKHPDLYIKDIQSFYNILNYSIEHRIKNFVFASSSSVYGKDNPAPFLEEYPINNPASIYAASKVCDEIIAKTLSSIHNNSITALRFFTVYGPYGRPDMAIHKFTKAIINDEPITINGDGTIRRAYTYIDDVVQSIYRSIFNPQKGFNVFNVGNEGSVNLLDVIHYLEDIIGKKANILFKEKLDVDMSITATIMDKFYSVFNYRSCISTREGLQKFVHWYKELYV